MTAQVQAELHWLHSADLWDLEHGAPDDPECFCLSVQAMVGERGAQLSGEDTFEFLVCTPRWLETQMVNKGNKEYEFGRHHLFLPRYDYALMRRVIEGLCEQATGPDWDTVATRLARYAHWEFEGYREYEGAEAAVARVAASREA